MTEFLRSIKSDLLSRNLLPLVVVLAVALVAAFGYALTAGSGSPSSTAPTSAPTTGAGSATRVSAAPENPHVAVSETPAGVRYQSQDPTRDPFVPLASPSGAKSSGSNGPSSHKTSSSGGSSGGSSASGGSSGAGSGGGGGTTPAPAPKQSTKPVKPQPPYAVSVLFGLASNAPGQAAALTPYESLSPRRPLPSARDARISFERVTSTGKGAVFELLSAPILHGSSVCLPSASECHAIELEVGQSEELEYFEADGQAVVYELKIVSIVKNDSGASAARRARGARAARAKREAHTALVAREAHAARAKRE